MCQTYSVKISTPSSPRIKRSLSVISSCKRTAAASIALSVAIVDVGTRNVLQSVALPPFRCCAQRPQRVQAKHRPSGMTPVCSRKVSKETSLILSCFQTGKGMVAHLRILLRSNFRSPYMCDRCMCVSVLLHAIMLYRSLLDAAAFEPLDGTCSRRRPRLTRS